MAVKRGDFIEIDYTGKIKDEGRIFDTTILKVAEEAGLIHKHEEGSDHDHSDQFSSRIICVGEKHVLPGLDAALEGANIGEHRIILKEKDAFGKKDAKLITTFPLSFFKKQQIQPQNGMQLDFDGRLGTIRSVGAGRVMVDFNHPLSGRDVEYDIMIKRIISDNKEKLDGLLDILRFPAKSAEIKNGKAKIEYEMEIPEKYLNMLKEDIKRLIGIDSELKMISEKVEEKEEVLSEEKKLVKKNLAKKKPAKKNPIKTAKTK